MLSKRRSAALFLIRGALVTTAYTLSCLLAPPPAVADDQAHLEQLLDAWADAIGGRERLALARTTHILYAVKMFGLEGTLEEWSTAEGSHRLDLDLSGTVKLTLVRTPDNCWLMDQNGKVIEQEGKDLEDETRDIFLRTWSHLLPARMDGTAELLPPDPETGALKIKILPQDGTEATFWIDPDRHLPVRWESPAEAGETLSTTLADWRSFQGVLVPANIHQTTGTPENDMLMALQEIQINESPPAGAFDRPKERTEEVRFASGRAATDIPLDIDGVHIFLQAHLNDSEPLWFLLDTGASMTIIDREVADELGIDLTGQVMGDGVGEKKVAVTFGKDVSFRLHGVELGGQTVAVVPVHDIFEARFGRELDGILGYDFISRFVVGIDYLKAKLHLYEREGWKYEGNGTEVPIRIVDTRAVLDAAITLPGGSSIDCNLYVDTGSGVTLRLNKPFTEEHDLLSFLPKKLESTGGYGVGGATRDTRGRIAALKIGELEFKAPTCSFSHDDKGVGADATMSGKVGGGILERCTVFLDYERQRVILEPNPRFERPFLGEMSGLSISTGGRRDWHTFTVTHVVEGSPGHEAGVKVGDVIISMDGKPASALRKSDLTAMLREKDRKVRFGLRRDAEILFKELHVRPML